MASKPAVALGTATEASNSEASNMQSNAIDLQVLSDLFGGNQDKVCRFAFRFIETARQGIDELEEALGQGDLTAVSKLGHRCKSSARAVGANGFADLCQTLEKEGETSSLEDVAEMIRRLKDILETIDDEINAAFPA